MKQRILFFLKWLIPLFFLLLGLFLVPNHGYSFLGAISFTVCGIICIYFTLTLLHSKNPRAITIIQNILTAVICIVLVLFSVTEICILRAVPSQLGGVCDYIVVLGCKVNGATPSVSLQERIDAAYTYLDTNKDTVAVLSGGKGSGESISEARCMYDALLARGINANRLWLEEKSTSTWENMVFSLNLIRDRCGSKPASIGIISSEYHLFRAGLFAKRLGVEPVGIPAATGNTIIKLNYFLREVGGVWHYLILGGQYHD